jgi:short-subunit dehydrogenase
MKLKDKIVIITGASEGLGKELAIKISENGAQVILLARTEKNLIKVNKEIQKIGGKSEYKVCDVTDFDQAKKTIDYVKKKYGSIDILINNAGIWFEGPTVKHSPEMVKDLFMTNSLAPIYMTQLVLPIMENNANGGIIFNVVSDSGLHPSGEWGVYVATKFAAKGFTDSLREEMKGKKIKVLGLYQGGMNTNFFLKAGFSKPNQPWMMDPKEVAEIIIFMLSRSDNIDMKELEVGRHK